MNEIWQAIALIALILGILNTIWAILIACFIRWILCNYKWECKECDDRKK